jgi:hypothetical protein
MIDRADLALLNAVSEDEWAAYLLAGDASMEAIMNKPSHGLAPHELSQHFFKLWTAGLIECSLEFSGPPVTPDSEQTKRQFERTQDWPPTNENCLVYRLSKPGGEMWEHFARPDWGRFLLSSVGEHDNEWTLTGADRDLVQRWRVLGSSFDAGFPAPLAGTENWEIFRPWQATYWKILPVGHRLKFEFTTWKRSDANPSPEDVERVFEFQREVWGRWHEDFDAICKEHFASPR